jgi:hypothetical protein
MDSYQLKIKTTSEPYGYDFREDINAINITVSDNRGDEDVAGDTVATLTAFSFYLPPEVSGDYFFLADSISDYFAEIGDVMIEKIDKFSAEERLLFRGFTAINNILIAEEFKGHGIEKLILKELAKNCFYSSLIITEGLIGTLGPKTEDLASDNFAEARSLLASVGFTPTGEDPALMDASPIGILESGPQEEREPFNSDEACELLEKMSEELGVDLSSNTLVEVQVQDRGLERLSRHIAKSEENKNSTK